VPSDGGAAKRWHEQACRPICEGRELNSQIGLVMAPKPSVNWKMESVLAQLHERAKGSGTVAAQVFLSGSESDIGVAARQIVSEAAGVARVGSKPPSIGRISTLAKSFSLTAEPAVFDALARHPRIKSILPSEIADIYPKPRNVVRDPPNDLN
jgi:hypothetical protein